MRTEYSSDLRIRGVADMSPVRNPRSERLAHSLLEGLRNKQSLETFSVMGLMAAIREIRASLDYDK